MKRPTGVTILAVLAIIAGALYLLSAVPFFGIGGLLATITGSSLAGVAGSIGIGIGVLSLVLGVLYLVLGFGAMSMKSWAWTLGIVVAIVAAVFAIGSMFLVGITVSNVISAVLAIGVLVYLYTADVRTAFGHPSHSGSSTHTPSMTA